ncbi:MAG: hypothetical protein JWO71_1646 [Candidatus Acidoferrum typicum]|nr:hypothetical protein [Candidatus Acidoferrum typicum]
MSNGRDSAGFRNSVSIVSNLGVDGTNAGIGGGYYLERIAAAETSMSWIATPSFCSCARMECPLSPTLTNSLVTLW